MRPFSIIFQASVAACLCVTAAQAQQVDLYDAIARSNLPAVLEYLDRGGNPNAVPAQSPGIAVPGQRSTPSWPLLQIAIYDREEDIALALVDNGADFALLRQSLGLVASQGMPRLFAAIIEKDSGRLLNASPIEQAGILQGPISGGYFQSLEAVLTAARQHDYSWDRRAFGEAAARAVDEHHYDLARMLYAEGAPVESYAIRLAARNGSPGIAQLLLALGADPNARLEEHRVNPGLGARTAMDYAWIRFDAARTIHEREVAALVMYELTRGGASPVAGRPENIAADGVRLLNSISDPDQRLIQASRLGFFDIAEAIVQSNLASRDALREATSVALQSLNNDIAILLIRNGSPVDGGPLHAAAAGNSPGIVRELLALGADPAEVLGDETPVQRWWSRTKEREFGFDGDLVLHELINGGANACWLSDHSDEFDVGAAGIMYGTATRCR
jgi:ankyrin repeat protein